MLQTDPIIFEIASLDHLTSCIESGQFTHLLSIVDNEYSVPHSRGLIHRIILLEDRQTESASRIVRNKVEEIIQFGRSLRGGDRLLVHCHSGVSRSPAAMMAILAARGYRVRLAVDTVVAKRPEANPNHGLLVHADAVLGLKGELIRCAADAIPELW